LGALDTELAAGEAASVCLPCCKMNQAVPPPTKMASTIIPTMRDTEDPSLFDETNAGGSRELFGVAIARNESNSFAEYLCFQVRTNAEFVGKLCVCFNPSLQKTASTEDNGDHRKFGK